MQKLLSLVLFAAACLGTGSLAAETDTSLPVLLREDFENGFSRRKTSDPDQSKLTWEIIKAEPPAGNHALRVTGKSTYEPPFRSPLSIALLKDVKVGDFELTVRVQNTHTDAGPHRDLCIFWGYQDPSHFYYVHLGAKPDPHACQIFIVNERTADDDH